MEISTTSDQSKTYSNSPSPLVWMSYGLVLQLTVFHKIVGNGLGWEQNGFWMYDWCYGTELSSRWKMCWLGSLELGGLAGPVVTFLPVLVFEKC